MDDDIYPLLKTFVNRKADEGDVGAQEVLKKCAIMNSDKSTENFDTGLKRGMTIIEVISQYPEQAFKVLRNMHKENETLRATLESIKTMENLQRIQQLSSKTLEENHVRFNYVGTEG